MENTNLTNIETVALVVDKPGAGFQLTPVVFDEVRDDEYLVEMLYSGICHTVGNQPTKPIHPPSPNKQTADHNPC